MAEDYHAGGETRAPCDRGSVNLQAQLWFRRISVPLNGFRIGETGSLNQLLLGAFAAGCARFGTSPKPASSSISSPESLAGPFHSS